MCLEWLVCFRGENMINAWLESYIFMRTTLLWETRVKGGRQCMWTLSEVHSKQKSINHSSKFVFYCSYEEQGPCGTDWSDWCRCFTSVELWGRHVFVLLEWVVFLCLVYFRSQTHSFCLDPKRENLKMQFLVQKHKKLFHKKTPDKSRIQNDKMNGNYLNHPQQRPLQAAVWNGALGLGLAWLKLANTQWKSQKHSTLTSSSACKNQNLQICVSQSTTDSSWRICH